MIQLPPFLLNFAKDFCAPLQVPAVWVMKCRKCHHSEDLGAAAAAALTPAATFQPPQISFHSPLWTQKEVGRCSEEQSCMQKLLFQPFSPTNQPSGVTLISMQRSRVLPVCPVQCADLTAALFALL